MAKLERTLSDPEPTQGGSHSRHDTQDARARLLARLPVTERRLTLAGIPTALLEGGEGPPLVLLHGPSGYAAHWARVIPALVTRYRVIAPDLPGHGASGLDAASLRGERMLRWLDELCAQTCASPPTLVGELLGGAIALRFALHQPERVSRLVLVDSFGLSAFEPEPEFALALTRFLTDPNPQTHEQLWRKCARDLPAMRTRMGELWPLLEAYNVERALPAESRAALQELMAEFGLAAIPKRELARIALPTSLIWGRHDLATPLSVAQAASAEYGWPLFVIEHANDAPAIEQPEAFVQALTTALAGASNPKGARP